MLQLGQAAGYGGASAANIRGNDLHGKDSARHMSPVRGSATASAERDRRASCEACTDPRVQLGSVVTQKGLVAPQEHVVKLEKHHGWRVAVI